MASSDLKSIVIRSSAPPDPDRPVTYLLFADLVLRHTWVPCVVGFAYSLDVPRLQAALKGLVQGAYVCLTGRCV